MRRCFILTLPALCAMLIAPGFSQNVTVAKMALMTFTGSVEIKAAPAQVWAALTEINKMKAWYPGWKNVAATAKPISSVGQTLDYVDEWNNAGKTVVIYLAQNQELRLAHTPNDGSYVCQLKFKLEPKGAATLVTAVDQYSDALDVPVDKDTALLAKNGMMKYLAALKAVAEKGASAK